MNNSKSKVDKISDPHYDQQILELLSKYDDCLALDTISKLTGIPRCACIRVLESLSNFKKVESFKQLTSYWRLKDGK